MVEVLHTKWRKHDLLFAQDKLQSLRSMLAFYGDEERVDRLPLAERKWWSKVKTLYGLYRFKRLMRRVVTLWNEFVRINNTHHEIDLSNIYLTPLYTAVDHMRFIGCIGVSEITHALSQWSIVEDCLEKTLRSIKG